MISILHPYKVFPDGTEVLHTQLLKKPEGETVEVHFERPAENGFCTARCELPGCRWLICKGFSQEQPLKFVALHFR